MIDMTDRIEHDDRIVSVLKRDADAALARWRKKGWTHVHSSYEPNPAPGDPVVIRLHFQRPAQG